MKKVSLSLLALTALTVAAQAQPTLQERNALWAQWGKTAGQLVGAQSFRMCQPNLRICNSGVSFQLPNGHTAIIRQSEDAYGNVIKRDTCEYGNFGDIRTCVDFDTGATSRDMQSPTGDWSTVGN